MTDRKKKIADNKQAARALAEADARNRMLLAAGYDPNNPEEAERGVRELLSEPEWLVPQAYSVTEFCEKWGVVPSKFYRHRHDGTMPPVHMIAGQPRILLRSIEVWEANLPKEKPPRASPRVVPLKAVK
jgi:hypothetical protein